jgi:2-polyprenyl-3-methyl-5-hydroxy-6-metoxy-1,4-benzoquinol methylase
MTDERRAGFAEHMVATLTGGAMTMLISLGYRTGLFEAAAQGPATSAALAARAGVRERYAREWLGAMVTGGFLDHDPATGEYSLPAGHAPFLTGETAANLAPMASMLRAFGGSLPSLERSFVEGGGVSHAAFRPHFDAVGAVPGDSWRRVYEEQLVDGFLAAVPGLTSRLRDGVSVLDLGCGSGHAVRVAARAFPASRFTGLDIDAEQITAARASVAGVGNAEFVVGDAAALPASPGYDVILAFDAIHDQQDPAEVLRRIHGALAPGGVFVMVDAKFSSRLENNVGNPLAPLCYAISLMYCTTVSLAEGGAGLGAMWGIELATEMLTDAGFKDVTVLDSPRAQNCLFVCQPG